MNCSVDRSELAALLTEDLDGQRRAALETHVAKCASCRERLDKLRQMLSLLRTDIWQRPGVSEAIVCERLIGQILAAPEPAEQEPSNLTELEDPMAELVGQSLGRYELRRLIGSGGWGSVFEAADARSGHTVALKVLRWQWTQDEEMMERFAREARTAGRLNHPRVVRLFALRRARDLHFLVMEYLSGPSVAARIEEAGPFRPKEALGIVSAAAEGLAAAHAQRIVHRDVKPQNILFSSAGDVKVSDFGLARLQDEAFTATGATVGTATYMAPEQIVDCRRAGPPADLYGLGCTLFHMLTGRCVFVGRESEILVSHLHKQPPDVREYAPRVPEVVAELIRRLLMKEPEARPVSAEALVRIIEELQADVREDEH